MHNKEVRAAIEKNGVKYYVVAKRMGISDTHLSRILRWELDQPVKTKILAIVEELVEEKWGGGCDGDE